MENYATPDPDENCWTRNEEDYGEAILFHWQRYYSKKDGTLLDIHLTYGGVNPSETNANNIGTAGALLDDGHVIGGRWVTTTGGIRTPTQIRLLMPQRSS